MAGPSALARSALERTGSGFKKLKNTTRNSSILADERHEPIIRKFNKKKYIRNLKIIYGE